MSENNKNTILKKSSLFNNKKLSNNNLVNIKYPSQNNLTFLSRKELNLSRSSKKKILGVADFIKQKNNFFIQNSFDVNGTREFLASKEVAMRVIKLNDEIIEEKNNFLVGKTNFTNKDLIKLNNNSIEADKKQSMKTVGKKTISPRKSRKSHKIRTNKQLILETNLIEEDKKQSGKKTISPRKSRKSHKIRTNKQLILETNLISPKKSRKSKKFSKSPRKMKHKEVKNEYKENSSIIDSESSKHHKKEKNKQKGDRDSLSNIYGLIIDNANEPEDSFNEKLKKGLKKVEKSRKKSINKNSPHKKKPKRHNSVKIRKKEKSPNAFLFSELTKNLMKNDNDISLSSISINNEKNLEENKANKKPIKRKFASIELNINKIKERLQKEMKKDKDKKKNIIITDKDESNSDKESIISILSDLM